MANLRRHFNFSTKQSSLEHQDQSNSASDMGPNAHFDKHNLMNDICSCLDMCCSYIQALNSLCGAGSMLARNLLQTVQDVPAYHNVAQQFLSVWDEVGKATAGASAAVKTETLMMLQEVLNTLELGTAESSVDITLADSFQVIGSCLFSFIELQAQFSLSTWKSLSKLSKSFTNDAFLHSLNWKSHDRNIYKSSKNSELSSSIKKHFSHLLSGVSKTSDLVESPQSQFYVSPTIQREDVSSTNCQYSPQTVTTSTIPDSVVWSPSTTLWSTSGEALKSMPHSRASQIPRTQASLSSTVAELDEVINLLSCMPIGQSTSNDPHSAPNPITVDQSQNTTPLYRFWPSGAGPMISRHMGAHRSWSEGSRDITFGYDSWIWRSDNMNCSALPDADRKRNDHRTSWENSELQRWHIGSGENGSSSDDASSNQGQDADSMTFGANQVLGQHLLSSVRHRRHSSSDGLPETQESLPESREDLFWNTRNHKTSTWPLKQSSSRFSTELGWPDGSTESKCMQTYYNPIS